MGLSLLLTIRKELPAKFCLDISERDSPHGSKAGDDEVVVFCVDVQFFYLYIGNACLDPL